MGSLERGRRSPSTTSSGEAEAGGASGTNDSEQLDKILNFVKKRREMKEPSATKMTSFEFSDTDLEPLYKSMACQDCKKLPHPSRRYKCLRGHSYCFECYRKRVPSTASPSENPNQLEPPKVCGFPMASHQLDLVGYSHGFLPPGAAATSEASKATLEEEKEIGGCLRDVNRIEDSDPLYLQVFRNSHWKCPFSREEVQFQFQCPSAEGVPGRNVESHFMKCLENAMKQPLPKKQ